MSAEENTGVSVESLMHTALAYLEMNVVVTIPELEEELYDKHFQEWKEGAHENLAGRKRQRWENLTDWVKAKLTEEKQTIRMEVGGQVFLCYAPTLGTLHAVGDIMACSVYRKAIERLAQRVGQEAQQV